jgi:DNA-binding NtrC family response regulator
MEGNLAGHSVLIVEDEPLIALHIRMAFEKAGANAITVYSLRDAFRHVEQDGLSGAVLDYGLGSQDGECLVPSVMPVMAELPFRLCFRAVLGNARKASKLGPQSPEPDLHYQSHYADRS